MSVANSPSESRAAACGIGAAVSALGDAALARHSILPQLHKTMDSAPKTAGHARESATLAVGLLCKTLRFKFEAYAIPMFPKMIKALADKDRKVVGSATLS